MAIEQTKLSTDYCIRLDVTYIFAMQYDEYYIVKEHQRRRRQLEKLKTTKKRKYQSNKYFYEWQSNKHKKFKRAGWQINVLFEYETKLINGDSDDCFAESEIEKEHQIIIQEQQNEQTIADKVSLSSYFNQIEADFYQQNAVQNIQFPVAITSHIASLYANNSNHIRSLLQSARYWNSHRQINSSLDIAAEQATVIGTFCDELFSIFDELKFDYSMDVVLLILECVL